MKKIMFTLVLFLVFICNVSAFSIDMNKVNVTSRSDIVINQLDNKYKIDLKGFYNGSNNDLKAVNFTRKLVEISFNNNSKTNIKKELTNYLYISDSDGFETLSGVMFLDTYLDQIEENEIVLGDIIDIKTSNFNQHDLMSFVYVKDAIVKDKKKDIVLSYWLKIDNGEYKIFYPWIDFTENINKYFEDISYREETGNVVGDSYNKLSLDGNGNNEVSDDKLLEIYNHNKDSVVQITAMGDKYTYGSGFYLREGIVVTTWSLFKQFLIDGDYIYINDCNGNTYDVLGVVTADTSYDVVLLKIDKEIGKKVTLGDSKELYSSNKVFTINSKYNSGFSVNYGTNMSIKDGKIKNMFALSSSDIGSALFNEYNEVIGFNVGDKIYSELSYANSTNYLRGVQNKLINTKFDDIKYTKLDVFKENYYIGIGKEKTYTKVSDNEWNSFKNIGKLEKNIAMNLVKSSYKDGILSLRYYNDTKGMLNSIYLASDFTEELLKEGYELTFYNDQKYIYKNEEYQIILKDNFNYLIVLIMEI
jgi:hypothetical protein